MKGAEELSLRYGIALTTVAVAWTCILSNRYVCFWDFKDRVRLRNDRVGRFDSQLDAWESYPKSISAVCGATFACASMEADAWTRILNFAS